MEIKNKHQCPLCMSRAVVPFFCDGEKSYFACEVCQLRYMDPENYLSRDEEFAHYQTHENKCDDEGYKKFLMKLTEPLLEKLEANRKGLDYGCGPGPALAQMMTESGHEMSIYDPFYFTDKTALSGSYDFITCTETVEHFHDPHSEFQFLIQLLKPGGWLAVMTCFQTDDGKFATWQYRHDPTHVVFYKEETFRWLAEELGFSCEIPRKDVVLMQKRKSV